jgi:hypothetical protein
VVDAFLIFGLSAILVPINNDIGPSPQYTWMANGQTISSATLAILVGRLRYVSFCGSSLTQLNKTVISLVADGSFWLVASYLSLGPYSLQLPNMSTLSSLEASSWDVAWHATV